MWLSGKALALYVQGHGFDPQRHKETKQQQRD